MAKDELSLLVEGLIAATRSAEDVTTANQRLLDYLNKNPGEACAINWNELLKALRAARAFSPMAKLAECLIGFGCEQGIVRRQYGQALIELGSPSAAISVLEPLAKSSDSERLEAKGLIGRAHKDLYVKGRLGNTPIGKDTLQKALNAYGEAYAAAKGAWHGVNVAALLHRAKIDGVNVSYDRTSQEIASELLAGINEKERSGTSLEAWDWATRAEAHVAHENWDEADRAIRRYVAAADRDSFQLWGTLRQLEQVWKVGSQDSQRGQEIVNVLRGELARLGNGQVTLTASALLKSGEVKQETYERILGSEGAKAHEWIQQMLKCGRSVGQVRRRLDSGGTGTCFVVNGEHFNERWKGQKLLLTNEHVVTADPSLNTDGRTLLKQDALIRFQIYEEENRTKLPNPLKGVAVKEVLWCSKRQSHDATLMLPEAIPEDLPALDLGPSLPALSPNKACIYVIGHPGGRGLAYSIQQNELEDHENFSDSPKPSRVHYTSPTEGGSSGSPAFDSYWQVIALHHAGGTHMSRLNGKEGTYPANEGIWIQSICRAARSSIKDGEIWRSA
jgi:tetratricopeptide (TPR) repeat protein